MASYLEHLKVLDTFEHEEAAWLEKGNWSKMTWAAHGWNSTGPGGSSPRSFSEAPGGAFYNANELGTSCAVSVVRSLGPDVAERYFSLWVCYNDTTHSGYRAKFLDTTTTEIVVTIYKVESGTEKELGKSAAFIPEAGDRFALWVTNAGKVEAWRQPKGTGAWVKLLEATDSGTKYTAGHVGIDGGGSDPLFTEFATSETTLAVGSTSLTPNETENEGAKEAVAVAVESTETTTITSIELHTNKTEASTGTSLVLGIYAENAGKPGTLLGSATWTGTIPTNGWVKVTGLEVSVVKGTKYWLGAMANGGTLKIDVTKLSGGGTGLALRGSVVGEGLPAGSEYGSNLARGPVAFAARGLAPAPTVEKPANQESIEGGFKELQIKATNTLTYSATGLPTGLSIGAGTGLISGTPSKAGIFSVEVTVKGEGGEAKTTFTWTIIEATTLNNPGSQRSVIGKFVNLQLTGKNISTYKVLTSLPTGLVLNASTGVISGVPISPETVAVRIEATGTGGASTAEWTWTTVTEEEQKRLIVRERPDPRKLTFQVTGASSQTYRWGADERNPQNVPKQLSFGSQMPGGFTTCNVTLERRPDVDYGDISPLAPVRVYGQGGALTAFEGYISLTPFSREDDYIASPQIIGWAGNLKDDNNFQMVYVDRDTTKWRAESATYKVSLIEGGFRPEGFSSAPDTANGLPSLMLQLSDTNSTGARPIALAEYDAGSGNLVGSVYMSWTATVANGTAGGWRFVMRSNALDTGAVGEEHNLAGTSGAEHWTPATARRYLQALYFANVEAGGMTGSGKVYLGRLENVAVYGNHTLARQGSEPGGFYGWQIITDIIERAAPMLNPSEVVHDTFIIPHMVFEAPNDAEAAINEVNQFYLYDYGSYEERNFFWRPPGTGRKWRVRVKDGVKLTDQGTKLETAYNGVIVQYQDVAGITQIVGPTGSNAPVQSEALLETSPYNICNIFGRKRWALLTMNTITTSGGAVEVGRLFLEQANKRPSAGSISVVGLVEDTNGAIWPAWMVRAGDTIEVTDASNKEPHYVLTTNYDHETLTNTVSVDAPPNRLEWILNRLQVVIAPLGIG